MAALSFAGFMAVAAAPDADAAGRGSGPGWNELSPQEQQVLSPLHGEWDRLDPSRKQKWRGIAHRYPKMAPPEQQRMQQPGGMMQHPGTMQQPGTMEQPGTMQQPGSSQGEQQQKRQPGGGM